MSKDIKVGISDYKVAEAPDKLITLGLGSCIGIAIYNRKTRRGGLSHIMLPYSVDFRDSSNIAKFADLAIPAMVEDIKQGSLDPRLVAKIAGGASMFNFSETPGGSVGKRNTEAVEKILKDLRIPIIGQDTGGNVGRTMIVNLDSFDVNIRMVNGKIKTL